MNRGTKATLRYHSVNSVNEDWKPRCIWNRYLNDRYIEMISVWWMVYSRLGWRHKTGMSSISSLLKFSADDGTPESCLTSILTFDDLRNSSLGNGAKGERLETFFHWTRHVSRFGGVFDFHVSFVYCPDVSLSILYRLIRYVHTNSNSLSDIDTSRLDISMCAVTRMHIRSMWSELYESINRCHELWSQCGCCVEVNSILQYYNE